MRLGRLEASFVKVLSAPGTPAPRSSLNLYSHVMPLDEVERETLSAALVWSRCGLNEPKAPELG
jgi:hypothetical protein